MKVVALAGGTGSAKLLRGLASIGCDLSVVANVGDNIWMHGLYVCPDIDIAMYTLGGVADERRGWGISHDSHLVMERLGKMGAETWFTLGDLDLATSLVRTGFLRNGITLTKATDWLRKRFGVRQRILPATDSHVETRISTLSGEMHLQEFWVKRHGEPRVTAVAYAGSADSSPTPEARRAIMAADMVVVCPGNPITSIGPILSIPGFTSCLRRTRARITALSPMKGGSPFSGPAGKLMKAVGMHPDSAGVARFYSKFLDAIVIDESDSSQVDAISRLGIECHLSETRMGSRDDEARLARELLKG